MPPAQPRSIAPCGTRNMYAGSLRIAAFGTERDGGCSEGLPEASLLRTYLARSALVSHLDRSPPAGPGPGPGPVPALTEYRARLFGNVPLVVHDCPVWDMFDSDWYTSCRLLGGADVVVIKYSVNDQASFQGLRDNYLPMIQRALSHCSIPVIISALGARKNVPCTCPLCTSDRRGCVTTSEGVQLAKELGGTYLELHTLNDFYVQKCFGGVLEYFMIQSLNQKSSEKMKKRKKMQKCPGVQPPQLEQPGKMPILRPEPSRFTSDLRGLLLGSCPCSDVAFLPEDLSMAVPAHRVILCSASPLFTLLFRVRSPQDPMEEAVVRAAGRLFTVRPGDAFPGDHRQLPSTRVVVKDPIFCSCLTDILHFIYSGAFQWEQLEEDIKEKLKDLEKTEHVLEKVKSILNTPGKLSTAKDCRSHQMKRVCSTSLRLFFNTPVLADVIFKVQGATVPAHRAVLVARCEVMAAMFNGNYLEASSVLVPVYGVSKDTFLSFLEYLYTDSCCPASILQAMSLLICAEMYQVMRLQHMCELYIITQLQSMPTRELASTSLSIVSLLKKAKFHNSDCLSTWLLHFIATNYLIFSQKPEFQDLSGEDRAVVERHRWPPSLYLQQLAEYQRHLQSRGSHCSIL
ncbi:rho-related BTB domain-containing protein 3 [Heliangelus exortis]|uniref:rho-related BTB domain-containing protein 3 n=1 Tax=Heliangelus exortis TaxID=472823 RepID=UPI003A8EACDE